MFFGLEKAKPGNSVVYTREQYNKMFLKYIYIQQPEYLCRLSNVKNVVKTTQNNLDKKNAFYAKSLACLAALKIKSIYLTKPAQSEKIIN